MPSLYTDSFAKLSDAALQAFGQRHDARERGLRISRQVIRLSANAIRAVHRGEFRLAKDLIAEGKSSLMESIPFLQTNPEIYHAGFLVDARKEFSEANITLALLSGDSLPQPDDIGVDVAAYLKGLGDAAGEMRRYILDSLRKDHWERCEEIMEVLDELYSLLTTIDFPEGVTGGLRRSTDMVRGTLERTRGDFTMALRQRSLEKKLASWEDAAHNKSSANP
jgi:translin